MGLVRGEDVVIYIPATVFPFQTTRPIACARSITFNTEVELIETSITGSGRYRTYIPGAKTYTGSLEGLVFLCDNNDPKAGLIQMQEYIDSYNAFHFTYYMTDGTIEYLRDGAFYIESINETSSFDNISTFTVNFRGTTYLYNTVQ